MATIDWWLDSEDPAALVACRHAIVDYLTRHAAHDSDMAAAELVIAELLANVHRHARGPSWVSVDWRGSAPLVRVFDLGPGFDLDNVTLPGSDQEGGRGLFLVSHLTEHLSVARRRAGGAVVETLLPVGRPLEQNFDLPRTLHPSLPAPDEADENGNFGKESFLRALVVQLAQHVSRTVGPSGAEQAIAQVGTDVGGRMEEEYRRARELVGQLTPTQIAELYVQLKHAIDGDFYVIEANEDFIRLGNRRCPFGAAVRSAPHLCRMTSSVFGGIAARNSGGRALVQLEERIALGDPGCLVTVWLRPGSGLETGHLYNDVVG